MKWIIRILVWIAVVAFFLFLLRVANVTYTTLAGIVIGMLVIYTAISVWNKFR